MLCEGWGGVDCFTSVILDVSLNLTTHFTYDLCDTFNGSLCPRGNFSERIVR